MDTPSPLLLQPTIDFDQIELKEKVGHGSYGVVYKAFWRDRFVAVKEFGASAEQKAIETEVKQLSRVRHDNIIALFGISSHQQSKYLIMEYAEGGSLHNFLHGKVKPYYSTAHAMSWARQCAVGVAYLHAMTPKPLIHRDLKPLNLLLTNKGRHLKICDFGTVADKSTWMTNNKGSAAWMAPEVFEGSKYTEKCDIFSWGIVLWEVLTRQQPFKEIDNTYSIMWKIHKGERPPLIKDCPNVIEELMTSCWATAPDMRPSMQDVVDVMNKLAASFPGADEPLEYEFINQQIVRTDSNSSDDDGNYFLDFSSLVASSLSSTTSTQLTPTNPDSPSNTSNSTTATSTSTAVRSALFERQTTDVPTAAITASTRWDVIPEESEQTLYGPDHNVAGNIDFDLTPSNATTEREAIIRNCMTQVAYVPMQPLSVHVDPNAWDLNGNEDAMEYSKNDGKERLTVTDAKPLLPANSTIMSSNAVTKAMDETDQNFIADDEEEDDDDNVIDQSLAEMLGPELQPEKPIPNNPESQQIYREHRRLGKEYLRVVTDLYYAQDMKEKTLAQMDPIKRQEKIELLKKIRERDELLELYNNLKQQVQKVRESHTEDQIDANTALQPEANQQDVVADDGWVVITSNPNT